MIPAALTSIQIRCPILMQHDDNQLIAAAQAGDEQAFTQLVASCQDRVVQVAYGYLHNREEALDATQEAFLKAFRAIDRFHGTSSFWTWIYRITCNLCKDKLRQRARRPVTSIEDFGLENEEAPIPSEDNDPRETAYNEEMERIVLEQLQTLPENQRRILILREFAGLSYQEIADAVGCRLGTVMSRLFHARQKLAEVLEPYRETLLQEDR